MALPNKLFDVRNGDGAVVDGESYPNATIIVFKNTTSKNAMLESFAIHHGWTATIPDPGNPGATIANVNKATWFRKVLTQFLKDVYRGQSVSAARVTAEATAGATADGELP